jgi:hypothetical protein
MVKKISILIIVTAILVTGYISLKKLNYWERTVLIFKLNSSGQSFEGRRGGGFGESDRREGFERRPGVGEGTHRDERMNISDSARVRFEGRGQRFDRRGRSGADSLRTGRFERDTTFSARGSFDGRMRDSGRSDGRDFRGRNSINLNNVLYFLAVFAFFTVIAVYLEKVFCLITRKKNSKISIPNGKIL